MDKARHVVTTALLVRVQCFGKSLYKAVQGPSTRHIVLSMINGSYCRRRRRLTIFKPEEMKFGASLTLNAKTKNMCHEDHLCTILIDPAGSVILVWVALYLYPHIIKAAFYVSYLFFIEAHAHRGHHHHGHHPFLDKRSASSVLSSAFCNTRPTSECCTNIAHETWCELSSSRAYCMVSNVQSFRVFLLIRSHSSVIHLEKKYGKRDIYIVFPLNI